MTRVDFYLLDDTAAGGRDLAVCRITNKAFQLGHRVYILTSGEEETQHLDHLLWTFSAGSFIPHGCNPESAQDDMPVLIGHLEPPPACDDVLIALAAQVPECFSRFRRVAEVVGAGDEEKRLARGRFRFYRDRGYALNTHNL